ncbi:CHASE2 domain-containing protein [Pedobacter heparinus]|uniref:CHASE2 domain-containing protein n=1 Tax=Pedobacter heparinus TaxID=984 RepID=UPI00292CECFC|nr:CHASE2 domain-containing protein [Pedobacter heparinus]
MKTSIKWLISFAHAFLLLGFTAWWMNTGFTYGDEQLLIKWSSILKRVVFQIDKDPPKKDFIFINLAYEKALIPRADGLGNEVITDREKLAQFFQIVKQHQQEVKFTFCDVFLQGYSANDSLLQAAVNGIDKIVFPTHSDGNDHIEKLDVDVPRAIADYRMASSGFMKFKLFQSDTLPTVPVLLYEKINQRKLIYNKGFWLDHNRPSLNSMIIDYQIRAHELFEQGEYPVVTLSELLLLPEEVLVNEFLKDRFVILGDFNSDVHETVFGSTPGTLILINVYLSLTAGQHLISIWWLLFLLAGYLVFSRIMLFPLPDDEEHPSSWFGPLLGSATYLAVFSMISYLLFNQHLQVLIITLYINLLRFVIQQRNSKWSKGDFKKWLLELRETYFNFK